MYVVGVDVGSSSVRAAVIGVFDEIRLVSDTERSIEIWNHEEYFEQSSEEIWQATCQCIRECINQAGSPPISSIGFSATCSMVVVGECETISVTSSTVPKSTSESSLRDVIMWMDHRACKEAEFINQSNHEALQYVGGKISVEMEAPKLLWMKKNLPASYAKAKYFMDLADYMTFRATGSTTRSICTTTCKWNLIHGNWDPSFWAEIGLEDICENNFHKIGDPENIVSVGCKIGNVTREFAKLCGIDHTTVVASGMIDAHAGALAMMCAPPISGISKLEFTAKHRLSLLSGTSACFMAASPMEKQIQGIWGPYLSALVPRWYLHEGGQSACGALLDHIIDSHPARDQIRGSAEEKGIEIYSYINSLVRKAAKNAKVTQRAFLTTAVHVLPYFHGNRSPYADSTLTGMVMGLTLSKTEESAAIHYYGTLQSIAYETKHIIEHMKVSHSYYEFDEIILAGGLSKNDLFVQELADITQCNVLVCQTQTMLHGAGIVAATAASLVTLEQGMAMVAPPAIKISPTTRKDVIQYHSIKYKIFQNMYQQQTDYMNLMNSFNKNLN